MIAIGSDHGGYKLKEEVKKYLDEIGIKYKDFGTNSEERCDYPEFAEKQRQQTEINSLKEQMASMSQNMSDLMAMNKELMSKLNANLKKE